MIVEIKKLSTLAGLRRALGRLATISIVSLGVLCQASVKPPTLALVPATTKTPVVQGSSSADVFVFNTGGSFHGSVTLSVSGLPSGVSASWSSETVTPVSGTASATLVLKAALTAKVTSSTFTVTATGSGLTVLKNYSVQVMSAPGVTLKLSHQSLSMTSMGSATLALTATAIGGVTLSGGPLSSSAGIVSGLPNGVTASWSSPIVTSGTSVWTLTLTGSPTAAASTAPFSLSVQIVDAKSGLSYTATQSLPLAVSFTSPKLTVTPVLTRVPVKQGASATDLFSLVGGGSFHGNVTLSVTGLPAGVAASWSNPVVVMNGDVGSSTLTLSPSAAATVNWFTFTVTAAADGITVSHVYTIQIEPASGLQVGLSQSSVSIDAQGTASVVISALPINNIKLQPGGVGSSATLSSGLPAGITASMSAPSLVAGALNWTLTLTSRNAMETNVTPVDLSVQITDASSGLVYSSNQSFDLLVSVLANVTIGTKPMRTVPPTFMGLSHEWGEAQGFIGSSKVGVNQIYRQLLNNLTAYGSGPINLRIGGNSTDSRKEPTPTVVLPFAELASALGVQFELGVNLGSNNVDLAVDQAKAYLGQMPSGSILGFEIGNEPHLYNQNGLRPSNYSLSDYLAEFQTWKEHIMPLLPSNVKLIGPSWCAITSPTCWSSTNVVTNAKTLMKQQPATLAAFSEHFYVGGPADNPAADFLLPPGAATLGPLASVPAVSAVHAEGIPFRMDETSVIADGGLQGISDTFSAALWSIDTMFEYVNAGVDGLNWQASSGNFNDPFFFSTTTSKGINTYTLSSIHPLYYGFLFFQSATPQGAQLLPVSLTTPANLKAWATVDAEGTPRLALINKDETQEGVVSVTLPGFNHATILRLTAPSYTSTAGVSFGGQTFDGSTDGMIQGTQLEENIDGVANVFHLPITSTSAALVTFSK